MRNLLQRHPLAFALAIVAALLVVVIAVEAGLGMGLWPAETLSGRKPGPAAETKLVPPLAAINPDQAFAETTARPLFTPTRRPAPAAPVAANVMVKGQYTLQGVIATGDLRIALLREKASGRVHRLEKGKELNGITLAAVENDKVTLSQGGDQETLSLTVQKGPAVAAAPATAPPPPSAGPFGPAPGTAPAPQPGQPSAPGAVGTPAVAGGAPPPPAPTPNPATRSGFGPFAPPPSPTTPAATTSTPEQASPMTPEELLARRRARRAQQPQNQ